MRLPLAQSQINDGWFLRRQKRAQIPPASGHGAFAFEFAAEEEGRSLSLAERAKCPIKARTVLGFSAQSMGRPPLAFRIEGCLVQLEQVMVLGAGFL